jgi:hypothetical protein
MMSCSHMRKGLLAILLLAVSMELCGEEIENPDNGHSYQRFDTSMIFQDAKTFCESLGGYLTTITSQAEQDFVFNNLASGSPYRVVWLGGTDQSHEGVWTWITGETWSYTNWGDGEPNNFGNGENYLQMFTPNDDRASTWNDTASGLGGACINGDCSVFGAEPISTICEWNQGPGELIEVAIDIKPGSSPNNINPKSNGVIPVAILTTDTFDATTVDPLSVRFGPKGAKEAHNKGHIEDVNHDGESDLVLHFKTQATGIQCGNTSASLTGETFDGDPIQGSDAIKTVGCKK